jgi:type IV pilus assembly protein PilA
MRRLIRSSVGRICRLQSMKISTKTKLALIRSLNTRKSRLAQGFTLVELMIVVAIVGILSAVALPQFLGARSAAAAGAAIGELIGQAKECGTFKATGGIGVAPSVAGSACASTGAEEFSRSWEGTVAGVRCLGATSAGASVATVSVASDGGLSCVLS